MKIPIFFFIIAVFHRFCNHFCKNRELNTREIYTFKVSAQEEMRQISFLLYTLRGEISSRQFICFPELPKLIPANFNFYVKSEK